jgi:hypothetical protein
VLGGLSLWLHAVWRPAVALIAVAILCLIAWSPVLGASPEPQPNPGITMSAEPLLGGSFRIGSWAAVRVNVENHGPAVDGELRMSGSADRSSTFSVAVQLASGARQEHILYGATGPFGSRITVSLVSGSTIQATVNVAIDARAGTLGAYLIAEQPQALVAPVRNAISVGGGGEPSIVSLQPEDLPPRVEAWSSADLIVWQDAQSGRLDADRLEALRTWLLLGGHLLILGGSTGTTTLGSFPPEILPFQPTGTLDVPVSDMAAGLGSALVGATPIPALGGTLERGVALVQTGTTVVAARAQYGGGSVSLIGFNPSTSWLADATTTDAVWARILPAKDTATRPDTGANDFYLVNALSSLPAVQLPRLDQVFLLILAYVVAIGPVNYLILRRRDRRELAWLTMPVTIIIFAIIAYSFGLILKGPNVIVNELAVVRGSTGTDRGLADVMVGVYSPSRAAFDVHVGGHVLVSAPRPNENSGTIDQPIDVLHGEPATVRNFGVGFGALRAFHAEAAVSTPRVEADLTLSQGNLEGTITNASDGPLTDVSVVYGSRAQLVGEMAPGESKAVSLQNVGQIGSAPLSLQLYPDDPGSDPATARQVISRRALLDYVGGNSQESDFLGGKGGASTQTSALFTSGPVILAWGDGGRFEVDVGSTAEQVGETLYVLPAHANLSGPVVFSGGLMASSIVSVDAEEVDSLGEPFALIKGTVAVEYRPAVFDGTFKPSSLVFAIGPEAPVVRATDATDLAPLPDAEQPDQQNPLASNPRPTDGGGDKFGLPRLQLFDRAAAKWIEYEPVEVERSYRIADPSRFVDEAGAFLVRFVVRGNDYVEFFFVPSLEGTVI